LRRIQRPTPPPPPWHVRGLAAAFAVGAHAVLLLALALVRLAEPPRPRALTPVIRLAAESVAPVDLAPPGEVRSPAGEGLAVGAAGGEATPTAAEVVQRGTEPEAPALAELMPEPEVGATRFARLDGPDGSLAPAIPDFEAAWERDGAEARRPASGALAIRPAASAAPSEAHRVGGPEASVASATPAVAPAGRVEAVPRDAVEGVARVVRVDARPAVEGSVAQAGSWQRDEEEERAADARDGADQVRLGTLKPWPARVVRRVPSKGAARPPRPDVASSDEVVAVAAVEPVLAQPAAHPRAVGDRRDERAPPDPGTDPRNAVARTESGAEATAQVAEASQGAAATMESFEADPAASQSVAALATPLGRYTQVALDLVNERWYDEDLPVEQRVAGVQGSVLVRFDVNRNGRVRGVKLMRRSGHAALDRMALRAVPSRLPAPPDDVDAPCRQQVAFRYINPFASID
jgi:TonB family protein